MKLLGLLLALCAWAASAAELRWGVQADVQTLDPHAQLHLPTNAVLMQVYEGLVRYDRHYEVEPALASAWRWVGPRQLRFELRPGVRFQDGSLLSADDVVFSFERLRQPAAQLGVQLEGVRSVVQRDKLTVDLFLDRAQPLLLRNLVDAKIMSRRWAELHGATDVADARGSRQAMGTGPYRLISWQPDRELVLEAHPQWWGHERGNIDRVRVLPLRADATRTAALLAGDVDLLTDVPPQDLPQLRSQSQLRVNTAPEIRTLYVGLDLGAESLHPGQPDNPLRDRRVRQALSLTVDREALRDRILFGLARPAALMVAPGIRGHDARLDQPEPAQPARAKALLAEAGYASGFSLSLHCPNNRYPRDEAICQALAQMWSRIGVNASIVSQPMSQHMRSLQSWQAPVYLYGWTAPNFDAQFTLRALAQTRSTTPTDPSGALNYHHLSDPELDALLTQLATEDTPARRQHLAAQALRRVRDEHWFIPLYHTVRAWAMRRELAAQQRLDERPELRWMSWGD